MVSNSKIVRRTPTKSIKDCRNSSRRRHHRRKVSPIKNLVPCTTTACSSSVIASINRSIYGCNRRLVKFFSKLARIGSPNRHKGFKLLQKFSGPDEPDRNPKLCRSLSFDLTEMTHHRRLPPLGSKIQKTIFLDLDETLIHSQPDPPPAKFDFMVSPVIHGERMNFYVLKRPGVDIFLEEISKKFEVVIFTAGLKEYASLVLDCLDPEKAAISHRLYRDSCKETDGKFVKDLAGMGRDLNKIVIVDDNPNSYSFQPENGIPMVPFTDDVGDRELEKLGKFLDGCDCFDDMRDAVKQYIILADADGGFSR